MKRSLRGIILVSMLMLILGNSAFALFGFGKKKNKKIKVGVTIANFDDTFLTYMMDSMKDYAMENEAEIEIEITDAKEDMAKQMDQVENFLVQQKDAVIVVPVDTSAAGPIISNVLKEKIPLVFVNRNPGNLPDGAYYVGSEEIVAGKLQMEFLAKELDGKANVAILMGKLDNEGALKRTEGNELIAKDYPGIKVLDKQTGKWQRNEGLMKTEDWLNRFGSDLNAVLCNNDDMALGAIQALKDSNRMDVYVLGVDGTPDGRAAVKSGEMNATVLQDAIGQGQGAVKVAFNAAKGEKVEKETWIPFKLITPENVKDFDYLDK
jgi:inositol transport system substrate-binding protein